MWLLSSLCCGMLLFSQPQEERPEPAAMILNANGVELRERGVDQPRQVVGMEMTLLFAGDELRAAEKGEALLFFFADGHRERLKGGARATVGDKGCTPTDAMVSVPAHRMTPQTLASLREMSRSGRLGGIVARNIDLPELPGVTPLYDSAVLTERPTLQWAGPASKDNYLVQMLTDPDEEKPRLLWQAQTAERRLVYPAKEKALPSGACYRWRVQPLHEKKPGEPLFESRFSVLPQDQRRVLADLAPLAKSDAVEDLLLLAHLYDVHAVYDEALRLYQRLVVARPRDRGLLLKLASYYELVGRLDEAKAARTRAQQLPEAGSK